MNAVTPASRWHARLDIDFAWRLDKTIIQHRKHQGPLVIQKPFYPEVETCHVYLIHPPGGVVGGDRIDLNVSVGAKAHALLTTPAANKFYRSAGAHADVRQMFVVNEGAILEWLPQENILFNDSLVNLHTRINIARNAKLLSWEIQCLGRPASHESFSHGRLRQRFELWQDNKPLFIDRSTIEGGSEIEQAQWGLAGYSALGSFILFPASQAELELIRQTMTMSNEDFRFSVSLIGGVLVCRCLAHQAEPMREVFIDVWARLRPELINKQVTIPRIWNT